MNKITTGKTISSKQILTEGIVQGYGQLSGDYNPIHFDDEEAKKYGFKGRIAHGLFCLGMISNLIGNVLPGPGSIFLDEQLRYLAPVYIGDEITATVTITGVEGNVAEVYFCCKSQKEKVVLEGTTRVLLKNREKE